MSGEEKKSDVQKCGCGASIRFVKMTATGKTMPIDIRPLTVNTRHAGKGAKVLVVVDDETKEGRVVRGAEVPVSRIADTDWSDIAVGYESHFATCPNAGSFRRGPRT